MTVKKSVSNAIWAFVAGAVISGGGTIAVTGVDAPSEIEKALAGARCDSIVETIISPAQFDSVDVTVRDSLGDSIGTEKQWRQTRARLVQNIDTKFNPNVVTMAGDTAYSIFWLKRGSENIFVNYGVYVPVEDRLLVNYTTSTEK